MSRRRVPHRVKIRRTRLWGKQVYHLSCAGCWYFQYTNKVEAQRMGEAHLAKMEADGEAVDHGK